jgi:hypothetical protein
MQYESELELRFDGSNDAAIHWAARSGLEEHLSLDAVEEMYERALPYLAAWAYALTTKYGWQAEAIDAIGDIPLALCLGRDDQFIVEQGEYSAPHVSRLVLPRHFSAFTDPELTQDWATMFANLVMTSNSPDSATKNIYQLGRAGTPAPLQNIIYLLQSISPGMLVVRSYSSGDVGETIVTDCGLPPALWVGEHIEDLEDVFGTVPAVNLYKAADDPYCAYEDVENSDTQSDSGSSFATLSSDEWDSWGHSDEDESLADFDHAEMEILHGEGKNIELVTKGPFVQDSQTHSHSNSKPVIADPYTNYRHCDAACGYCGHCSGEFAERLTKLLLRTAVVV